TQPIRSITIITHITASPNHYPRPPTHLTHPSDPSPNQPQPLTLRRWDTRISHPHR
ncbi:hypothetical protein P692DRAFT_20841954, partial [Suillus brevipes Sb2]